MILKVPDNIIYFILTTTMIIYLCLALISEELFLIKKLEIQNPRDNGSSQFYYLIPTFDNISLNETSPTEFFNQPPKYNYAGKPLKKILFWNDAYTQKHWGFGYGQEPFIRAGCKVNTCFTTSDRKQFRPNETDALIWHFRSIDRSLPDQRWSGTRYIFWMMESAVYLFGNLKLYNKIFNWTMTYRHDSDIPNLYGKLLRRNSPDWKYKDDIDYAKNKTKLVAWFVSNCYTSSKREIYVKNLSKYIQVDIYGKCGNYECSRKNNTFCHKMLQKDYKFFLSFENSLCLEYITEKFYHIMRYNVIPVVYGLGPYDKIAPPYSYINALDYSSSKELADYLKYLDKNPQEYNKYFRWKKNYTVLSGWARKARSFCILCEQLHTDSEKKMYPDLVNWFVKKSKCMEPKYNYNKTAMKLIYT